MHKNKNNNLKFPYDMNQQDALFAFSLFQ